MGVLEELVGEGGIAVIRVLKVTERGLDASCWERDWG